MSSIQTQVKNLIEIYIWGYIALKHFMNFRLNFEKGGVKYTKQFCT